MADNEKKAFKINIIDVIITVIIVAVLAVGTIMIASAFGFSSKDKEVGTVEYVIQFKGVMDDFADNVKKGDEIVDSQKRHVLGKVKETKYEVYNTEVYNEETRELQIAENPDYITLEVTVTADAYVSEQMIFLTESEKEIGVGTFLYIHAPDFCGGGYISAMNFVEKK